MTKRLSTRLSRAIRPDDLAQVRGGNAPIKQNKTNGHAGATNDAGWDTHGDRNGVVI